MAITLTQPFISTIPPQAPGVQLFAQVNVLGGDLVDRIYWELTDINENPIGNGSQVVTDTVTDSIRSFWLNISGITLVKNTKYSLSVYTQNTTNNVSTNSIISQAQVFNCYIRPTVSLYYISNGSPTPLTNNTNFTAQPVSMGVTFNKNDAQSPALLSYSTIELKDANKNVVYSAKAYGTQTVQIQGFADGQTYSMVVSSLTTDGLLIQSAAVTGITYTPQSATGDFRVEANNDCANGNIVLNCFLDTLSSNVEKVEIQRQEQGATLWNTLCTISNNNFAYGQFTFTDRLAGCNRIYLYRLAIITFSGSATYSDTAEVLSQFTNAYICNGNQSFKLTNSWTESDSSRVYKTGVYEPYVSKFPIVVNNAVLGYDMGTTSAVVLAANTEQNRRIDRFAEVNLAKQFADFLTDRKPKILKDFNGNLRIIAIRSNVSRSYVRELGNGICSTSFSWVEISDFSQPNVANIGLFDVATLDLPTYSVKVNADVGINMTNNATAVFVGSTYTNEFSASSNIKTPIAYIEVPGQATIVVSGSAPYTDGNLFYSDISCPASGKITVVVEYA